MKVLPKGGNCEVAAATAVVNLSWDAIGQDVGWAAFLLDANGGMSGAGEVVHAGSRSAPGVTMEPGPPGRAAFVVDMARLPGGIQKVVFYVYRAATKPSAANGPKVEVAGCASHEVSAEDCSGRVVAVCEIYERNGTWKFRALSQAHPQDVDELLKAAGDFGGDNGLGKPTSSTSTGSLGAPSVNLSKITLKKKGDAQRVSLARRDQEIVINLNWQQKRKLFGLFGAVDLDLGCFYELKDGRKSCIDGIQFAHGAGGPRHMQTAQGCYTGAPWIWHMGDDRSGGQMVQGENILVNPRGFDDLKRMTIYTFIYEGAARWSETNAVVTVKVPGNPEVEVRMGEQSSRHTFCVIANISFEGAGSAVVTKCMTFHKHGHSAADNAYSWGMRWQPGSK